MFQVLNRYGYRANDLSIHLVEISSTMQQLQANRLCVSHRETDIDMPHNHEVSEIISKLQNCFGFYLRYY